MKATLLSIVVCAFAALASTATALAAPSGASHEQERRHDGRQRAELGPRPFFLVDDMREGPLKERLQQCTRSGNFSRTEFSIGHRGAPLQFPEHTRESYTAAARMGAGIVECDVTFTKDKELVCRHAQNDLHTTTNILMTPLAAKCTRPFSPAEIDADGRLIRPAAAECRTSDITLAEFKTLRGKMDAANTRARTVQEYLNGTPDGAPTSTPAPPAEPCSPIARASSSFVSWA
jgi:glycerophosphoryl diester phosphodiesterase